MRLIKKQLSDDENQSIQPCVVVTKLSVRLQHIGSVLDKARILHDERRAQIDIDQTKLQSR